MQEVSAACSKTFTISPPATPDAQLVTFDGEVFEWQVVMTRAMVHGLSTPTAVVRAVGGRESHVDLRTIFKKDAPSLERLAAVLVVPDDNGLLTLNSRP
ncbi:hypothetical protein [Caenispirillum salinarum]|uniref:hypothetical protein n=1 Tax=Caenispirillum salinarum TaxID=859058 RepID=UPI00384EBBDD